MSAGAAKALKLAKKGGGRRPPEVPPDPEPEGEVGEEADENVEAGRMQEMTDELGDAITRIAKLEDQVKALLDAEAKWKKSLSEIQPGKLMTMPAAGELWQKVYDEATLDKVCSDAMFAAMGSAGNRNPWNSDLNRIVQAALTLVKVKLLERKKS